MGPKELKKTLVTCIQNKLPVLIKGAPGVGKSDIVAQAALETEHELILSHPVVSDPTDYKGLPGIVTNKAGKKQAEFLPFGDLRRLIRAKKPTIAFLDDLGQAPAVVQAACMQLILARRVNGHKVSDQVVFIAATNRREDRAGVTGILEPVKSRFAMIAELVPEKDDWIEWALQHDMPMEMIGFVNFRPGSLTEEKGTQDIVNHACPRTLANAGKLIQAGLRSHECLAGAVGAGRATELIGFMKYYLKLPNIDRILIDPDDVDVPDEPTAQFAVVSALVNRITKENAARILQYGERLPADFCMLLVRDSIRKNGEIQNTKAFVNWCAKHKDFFI